MNDLYSALKKAGFTNITKEEVDSGWLEAGKVVHIAIDDSENYGEGEYCDPNVDVVIYYSSSDRIDAPEILENWEHTDYERVKKASKMPDFQMLLWKSRLHLTKMRIS